MKPLKCGTYNIPQTVVKQKNKLVPRSIKLFLKPEDDYEYSVEINFQDR